MSLALYLFYSLIYLFLMVWAARLFSRTRRAGTLIALLVIFGVFYDNLILSLGNLLGEGPVLLGLSFWRFLLHQLILPWLIYAAFEQVKLAGHVWACRPAARLWVLAGSALVMVLGIITRILPLRLEPTLMDGVLRYVAVDLKGPPLVSILSIGFAVVTGAMLWRKNHWPWLFAAGVLIFIGEGVPVEAFRRLLGSGFEVVFMVVFLLTDRWLLARQTPCPDPHPEYP